jgi:hypothetical protein
MLLRSLGVLLLVFASAYGMSSSTKHVSAIQCSDFASREEAQDYFDRNPSSEQELDKDGDGIPCEDVFPEAGALESFPGTNSEVESDRATGNSDGEDPSDHGEPPAGERHPYLGPPPPELRYLQGGGVLGSPPPFFIGDVVVHPYLGPPPPPLSTLQGGNGLLPTLPGR